MKKLALQKETRAQCPEDLYTFRNSSISGVTFIGSFCELASNIWQLRGDAKWFVLQNFKGKGKKGKRKVKNIVVVAILNF